MLADGGPGHLEVAGDLARGKLGVGDEPQDGAATGLGERPERIVHFVFPFVTWVRRWRMTHFAPYR
jgi:hypothetical protein